MLLSHLSSPDLHPHLLANHSRYISPLPTCSECLLSITRAVAARTAPQQTSCNSALCSQFFYTSMVHTHVTEMFLTCYLRKFVSRCRRVINIITSAMLSSFYNHSLLMTFGVNPALCIEVLIRFMMDCFSVERRFTMKAILSLLRLLTIRFCCN